LDDHGKIELISTIVEESERLNRFIANLLDMTKLESGGIKPKTARHDIGEIVSTALDRASNILADHKLELATAVDLPMLEIDPVLLEQALFNLLDNAAKYSPAQTTVRIQSWLEDDAAKLQVIDEGGGIPSEDLERIFDKFYRVEKQDQVRAGTGLGLAISRGFIEAMGGSITAANRSDRQGAVFTITLPLPKLIERLDTAA
jgi:two-component system, OmpR family, sensor histidine kinase KdpD